MYHPVSMAFHMDYLDPEDRKAVRRWSARIAVVCSSLAFFLFGATTIRIGAPDRADAIGRASMAGISQLSRLVGMSRANAAEPAGVSQCASRDLRLVISIEARGEAQDVHPDELAKAFFTLMTAREACAAGRTDDALAAYDSIVLAPQAASDTPRKGWFTPTCARQDLRALGTIEQRGEVTSAATEWLADAGLKYLQARILCLSGHEDQGVALYDSIIDYEVSNARNTVVRVRR